ncbi:MAG: translation elongation factor Ts [Patescibacteria group bacterium]
MNITLDQIKSLRDKTGVSTMACKKALEEAGGDETKAIEMLRKKGEAKAAERADRSTAFGVVVIESDGNKTAMLSLGCETDFVAKNDDFLAAAQAMAKKLLSEGETVDLSSDLSELGIKMGEKIDVKDKKVMAGANIDSYVHSNKRIGVLVSLQGGTKELARDIAMHVAASNPTNLSPDEIDTEWVNKEKEIWRELLKAEGKPEAMWDKIMEGKEKKFREEHALLTQAFIKDPEKKIQDLLGSAEAKVEAFFRSEV